MKLYTLIVKRLLTVALFFTTLAGMSQVTVFSEDFNAQTPGGAPGGWSNPYGSFYVEDGTIYPPPVSTCNLPGSSGGNMLGLIDNSVNDYIQSPSFSTMGKATMTMDFNVVIQSGASITFSLYFSSDNFSTSTLLPFSQVTNNGNWASISSITIPSAFDAKPNVAFRFVFTSTCGACNGEFLGIDDVIIKGVPSPIFYYNGTGPLDLTSSWDQNTTGIGLSPPTTFTADGQTFYITNTAAVNFNNMTGSSMLFSGNGSSVNIGTGTTSINVTIPSTHTLNIGSGCGLNVTNQSTLTLQNSAFPSNVNINTGSTIDYAHTSGGPYVPFNTPHYNVIVSGGIDITATNGFTVNNQFNLTSGSIRMPSLSTRGLYIYGAINASGGQIKTGNSKLVIGGSGSIGTITFGTGSTAMSVRDFTLNRPGQTLTLGSNFTANTSAVITDGNININGKSLTFNGNTVLSAIGNFVGSSSSMLSFGGTGTITNNLLMSQSSSATKTLKALNVKTSGASLGLGNAMEITDSVKINAASFNTNGNLTLKSTSALKARVAEISGGGSLSGNITVETFIPGPTTDWAVLGASGVSGLTFNSWYGTIPMTIEGSATGVTSAGGQYFESVQGWNENDSYGYDTTITVGTSIATGKGYWLFVGTGLTSTSDITTVVSGGAVTGNQSLSLSKTLQNGDCLLANPFPSPISWDRIVAHNSGITSGDIWIYNADLGTTTNYAGGVSSHTNGAKSTIPMGQGFYVRSTGLGPLVISESDKVSNNTGSDPVIKSQNTTASVGNVLHLKINDGYYSDQTAIRFHGSATAAFDNGLDSKKWFESPTYAGYASWGPWTKRTSISTKSGTEDYAINSLPYAITNNAVIPVLAKAYATGQHTISVTGINNLAPGTCVTLKDKLLNITHNLAASDYVFSLNDTTSAPRFELTVCANVAASVNELNSAESNEISVFPNPSGGEVNISTTIPGKYEIVNQIGQTVFVFVKNNDYAEVIPVKELQSGIYFLKANSRNVNKKIIVTR